MDITKFIVSGRAETFGDNAAYRAQLSRRLLKCRKRLGVATKSRGKYKKNDEITAEQTKEKPEYVRLLLLTSERAWAHAMSMRTVHMADAKGITGRNRSHIISRIDKAARTAEDLVVALSDADASGATSTDILEAYAYAGMMRGAANFEKHSWERCLQNYAVSRAIYTALTTSSSNGGGETYKDLLSEIIDPSIQYAAYQLKTPRTVPVHIIARKAFPSSNAFLLDEVNKLDPNVLRGHADADAKKDVSAVTEENVPKTITWRSREVPLEDAATALAWAATLAAKEQLAQKLASPAAAAMLPREVAAAYDDILAASQDAVDAAKQAIDELRADNVSQTDPRMQSLQVTRTAVSFEMISWRIGRNRVLTGERDGAGENYGQLSKRDLKKGKKAEEAPDDVKPGRKLAKLRERVALYDGALQNLEEAKALPGVPADEELAARLDATEKYFTALKALSMGRSQALAENRRNALALLKLGLDRMQEALPVLSSAESQQPTPGSPPNIHVSADDASFLASLLERQVQRYRALVFIENERKENPPKSDVDPRVPLIDRLHEYPPGGAVDLDNIVEYPPKMPVVPLKPIFLDVAWNYIEYPGRRTTQPERNREEREQEESVAGAETEKKKRGWFGFGR